MGAANFHRDFSLDFARIAAPLEECRTTVGKIEWTEAREDAWKQLKNLFAQDILLTSFDPKTDVYLTTDASLVGIGAWIGQKDALGVLRPIVCASNTLCVHRRS